MILLTRGIEIGSTWKKKSKDKSIIEVTSFMEHYDPGGELQSTNVLLKEVEGTREFSVDAEEFVFFYEMIRDE